jgi:glycyl-tRNA synthetase beta chain
MVDAVLANRPGSPLDAESRLRALEEFLRLPEAGVLSAINKRIGNILRKAPADAGAVVQLAVLTEAAEIRLHAVLAQLEGTVAELMTQRHYGEALRALLALAAPVDAFFDGIMVMDENPQRRDNRLALLRDVQRLLGGVADLSRLPG